MSVMDREHEVKGNEGPQRGRGEGGGRREGSFAFRRMCGEFGRYHQPTTGVISSLFLFFTLPLLFSFLFLSKANTGAERPMSE